MIDELYDHVNLLLIALVLAQRRKAMDIDKGYLDQQFEANFQRTVEYFDRTLDEKLDEKLDKKLDDKLRGFATKDDLKNFATKDDLKAQTAELKSYVKESFEVQQDYVDERFKEVMQGMKIQVAFRKVK